MRKYCVREITKRAEEAGIRAARAALNIAEEWHVSGKRPATDGEEEEKRGRRLSGLKPILREGLNDIKKSGWKKLKFCVDSGAGETVMAEDDLPEVDTTASWGSKHGQKYEVANGEEIANMGEKKFIAHMVTTQGGDSGGKGVTAQVCAVHRPLMSVKTICRNNQRVVFDDEGSYIENKFNGRGLEGVGRRC